VHWILEFNIFNGEETVRVYSLVYGLNRQSNTTPLIVLLTKARRLCKQRVQNNSQQALNRKRDLATETTFAFL